MPRLTIPAEWLELDADYFHPNREAVHAAAADASAAVETLIDALRSYRRDAPRLSSRDAAQLRRALALLERIEDRVETDRARFGDQSDRFGDIAAELRRRQEAS